MAPAQTLVRRPLATSLREATCGRVIASGCLRQCTLRSEASAVHDAPSPSSNRTCGFPAYSFPLRAFPVVMAFFLSWAVEDWVCEKRGPRGAVCVSRLMWLKGLLWLIPTGKMPVVPAPSGHEGGGGIAPCADAHPCSHRLRGSLRSGDIRGVCAWLYAASFPMPFHASSMASYAICRSTLLVSQRRWAVL